MALPRMVPPRTVAGPCTLEQLDMIHQVLIETEDQVPPDATHLMIKALQQLISPLPTLQVSPIPDLLLAPVDMPTEIMEQDEVVAEKQAEVEEAEMLEASPAAAEAVAEAEAAIEVEEVNADEADNELEEEEEEDSDDLITHYFHVAESQSHNDENWLTVLWSSQDSDIQTCYQMEGLKYWDKMNDKAQAVNEELQA